MNPEITVVVPYYNERETIEYTLERVGEQSLPAKSAIFVNSSSTDGSSDVVDCWIQENQHRFTTKFRNVFEGSNNPASSKNVGIRLAKTEWVAFMDCGQNFEKNWLEAQASCAQETKSEVVSGVVYLTGENWIDRCATAQTYGYKRNVPCIPSTLVKKSVFDRTGLFLEGRRAGYDVAWRIGLKMLGIRRVINEQVRIRYIGVNYSSNLVHLFRKTSLYHVHTVRMENYLTPYVYVIFPFLILCSSALSLRLALGLVIAYFLARSFLVPFLKSPLMLKDHPLEFLFGAGIIGMSVDLARMVGVLKGIRYYYFSKAFVSTGF